VCNCPALKQNYLPKQIKRITVSVFILSWCGSSPEGNWNKERDFHNMKTIHCTVIKQEKFEFKMPSAIDTILYCYFDREIRLYKTYVISAESNHPIKLHFLKKCFWLPKKRHMFRHSVPIQCDLCENIER
jgi:hypothetical protein